MTTLPKALKESGLVPPIIQRVWQWVKDNGAHDVNAVASALGLQHNSISSTLGLLCHRGMATRKKEMDHSLGHERFVYTVPGKLKKYELLPMTEASKNRPKRGQPKPEADEPKDIFTRTGPTDQVLEPAAPPPATNIIDTMNVREAYALYLELQTMFHGKG
jgi:hypothetical protein